MFTVTLSLGDRGYTREVWTWSCDMEVGGSGNVYIWYLDVQIVDIYIVCKYVNVCRVRR